MKGNLRAYLELTVAMVLVGSSVVVGKLMAESLPVFLAGGLSSAIGAAILVPVLLLREGGLPTVSGRDLLILFLQALTGIFLFRVFLLWGLLFTTAAEGGVITSTTPAVVGLISFFFLKERLGPRVVVGIVLSVLGIVALNVLGSDSGAVRGPAPLLGNLLVFGAVISEALFTIFGKAASERVTPLATAASASVLSLALFLPLGLYQAVGFDFSSVGLSGWVAVLHYGVFVTALGYLLWFGGLSRVPASTAGVFTGCCLLAPCCSPTPCSGSRSRGRTLWGSPAFCWRSCSSRGKRRAVGKEHCNRVVVGLGEELAGRRDDERQPSRTARSSWRRRSGSAIASISMIFSPLIVKPGTKRSRPRGATTPTAPSTV